MVTTMKTYLVRVFHPSVYEIKAEDEAHALAEVAELYKHLYKQDIRTWIEEMPQPEGVK
jgi:hypothetical protein